MKKILLLLLVLLVFGSDGYSQSSEKHEYPKPSNYRKRVTTIISGKTRSYYSLSTEKASLIKVRGPGVLRIITRGRFQPGSGNHMAYTVKYTVDGGDLQNISFDDVEHSKNATYLNGSLGIPGELKDFRIELGRGYHSLEFKLKDDDVPVALRYIFIPEKEKDISWISFCPLQPSEPVDLAARESIVTYYRFSAEQPLMAEVIGPTKLRMLTRVENHYRMRGRVHYRLQVIEGDDVINTYQLSSRRSQVTTYRNEKGLVPGKAREIVIDVPEGTHVYEIIPLDKDKQTLLGRFLIPKKDISLGG